MSTIEKPRVYIGGFGGSWRMAELVGEALAADGSDVIVSTYSHALAHPESVAMVAMKAHVITHSAGFSALMESVKHAGVDNLPSRIQAVAAPDASSSAQQLLRSSLPWGQKTRAMSDRARREVGGMRNFGRFMRQEACELTAHPLRNLATLGKIATYNSIKDASRLDAVGVPVQFIVMEEDHYFTVQPNALRSYAQELDLRHISINALAGQHDDLVMKPNQFVPKILALE